MSFIDVFNGDADGLCALHQLRLAEPAVAELVTGPKHDIALLARVIARPGDCVTVLDVSLDRNRAALLALLAGGLCPSMKLARGFAADPSVTAARLTDWTLWADRVVTF